MNTDRMLALAVGLGEAKSRHDVAAALSFCHRDMILETPAFGSRASGLVENEKALTRFFASFPDYDVVLEDHAANQETLICWGRIRLTMTGDRFGVSANGSRAEVPVFIEFKFRDDLIVFERFFFDLSSLCAQCGVSTDEVRRRLFGGARALPNNVAGVADCSTGLPAQMLQP